MAQKPQPSLSKKSKTLQTPKTSPKSWKQKMSVILTVAITGICLSAYLQRVICHKWEYLSKQVYGFSHLTDALQKLTVFKQTLLYMTVLQIIIAKVIINIRIFGQKINPVADKDPLSISLLNRILSNNLQQSFVFFGLYSYILLSSHINLETPYVFCLPLIFLFGRVLFALAYILATLTGIVTLRSFGFAFSVWLNFFIIFELILNFSDVMKTFLFA